MLFMRIESIIYENLEHLIEINGITERMCILNCNLSQAFFSNYRNGINKHFKIHDIYELSRFFDVSMDYLCNFKNTRDEFFVPKYKMKPCEEKILLHAFRRLDYVGRIKVADAINAEMENVRAREKERRYKKKKDVNSDFS